MNNKRAIIEATVMLIREKGEQINEITVREICKKANVGLGLINYHFGNKDKLIEQCVEYIINGIIDKFYSIQEKTNNMSAIEKLEYLGNMTLTFLFDNYSIAKVSILSDMKTSKEDDNTHRTYQAYLPLLSACRLDWDEKKVKQKTLCLILTMQSIFLRHNEIYKELGIDLTKEEDRKNFYKQIVNNLLENR